MARKKKAAVASDIEMVSAAKLTDAEIDLINEVVESLLDHRPLVMMAAAAHIIGTVARGSEGVIDVDRTTEIVRGLVQV